MLHRVVMVFAVLAISMSASAATLPAVGSGTLRLHLQADVGVSTSGSNVTQWNDSSGLGNNFNQTNVAQQPVLVNNVLNGMPAIRFTNDQLNVIGAGLNDASALDFTFFAVVANHNNLANFDSKDAFALFDSAPGNANVFRYSAFNGANPNNPRRAVELHDGNPLVSFTSDPNGTIISTQAFLNPTRNLENRTFDGLNGQVLGTASSASTAQVLFSNPKIGSINGGGNGFYSGDIAEIIYYDGKLNAADRGAVENYLSQKYNINLTPIVFTPLPDPAITASAAPFNAGFGVNLIFDDNINTDYASAGQGTNTFIDFDFGSNQLITRVDYTDRRTSGVAQGTGPGGSADNVTEFDLIFSSDAIFGNGDDKLVHVFSPNFANTDQVLVNGGDGFTARFVRWDVTAISGPANNVGAAEFAFFTTPQIPEPATLSLIGLAGLALLRRRKQA